MVLSHVTAILTGAAGGLGRQMTADLLHAGARVLAVDRSAERLEQFAKKNTAHADRLRCCVMDLARPESAQAVVAAALAEFGGFNVLICNAGIGRASYTQDLLASPPKSWEVPQAAWSAMFEVNALSAIRLVNEAVPVLLRERWARIVAVTTSLDSMLNAGTGPYGPSKAALEAFTAVIADELKGSTVMVNVLVPGGAVDTEMIPAMPGLDRDALLKADVMTAPLLCLLSTLADGITARRFRANLWDGSVPVVDAIERAGGPIAWSSIAVGQRRALTLRDDGKA